MATWNSDNIIITKKGEEVLSKVLAGIGKLTISRVVTGAGYVSPSKLYSQTQVSDIRQELDITSYSTTNEGTSLALRVSNKELESSYPLYQIGIYVTHPDFSEEVLYVIAQCDTDNPDIIPLPSETPVSLNYNFYLAHNGTSDVGITISDAGLVSVGEFESYKQEVNTELGKKATKEQGEKADTAVQSIEIDGVEQSKTVDGKVNLPAYPTKLPADGGNAATVGGKYPFDFVNYLGEITDVDNILNNPSYGEYPYEGIISSDVATNIGLPAAEWNIKCFRASEGSGCQIAFPVYDYLLGQSPKYRLATKTFLSGGGYVINWGKWNNISDNGNADTVDGKHANEFMQFIGDFRSGSILDNILTLDSSGYIYFGGSNCTNMPVDGTYFFGEVRKHATLYEVIATNIGTGAVYTNHYNNSGIWYGWKNVSDGGNAASVGGKSLSDLMVWGMSYDERTKITSGDLNDYTKVGSYVVDSSDTAAVIKNSPWSNTGYFLDVYYRANGYCVQVAMTWNGYIKIRSLNANTTWYEWKDIVHSNYVASPTTPGIVTTNTQHFTGYKTFNNQIGVRTGATVGTMPSSDKNWHYYFVDSALNKFFGDLRCCMRGVDRYSKGEVDTSLVSVSNDCTGINSLTVRVSNNNSSNAVYIGTPTVSPTVSCLRQLASGTAEKNTTNCPIGTWYGKHD